MGQSSQPLTEAMYYILLSVIHPLHGYGIMQKTAELSNNRLQLAPGTLYGALQKLEKRAWIRAVAQDTGPQRKKMYVLTSAGQEVLEIEIRRLEELVANGRMAFSIGGFSS